MDRLAIIQGQKIVERTVRFSMKGTIESMDRLAKKKAKKIETTVPISLRKRLNLWIDWLQSRAKKLLKQWLVFQ